MTTVAHLLPGSPRPKPIYQAAPQASLNVDHPQLAREAAEKACALVKDLLPADRTMPDRDIHDVLSSAIEMIEAERQRRAAEELSKRIIEQQAAEQLRRDRLTAADPEVIEAREALRRLNSAGLQLLLQAENLTRSRYHQKPGSPDLVR